MTYNVFAANTLRHAEWPGVLDLWCFWPWTFVLLRVSRGQTMYHIWAKSNNPLLSYSDLNVKNLRLSAILDLTRSWFSQLRSIRTPVIRHHVTFQQNSAIRDFVIDWTNVHAPIFTGAILSRLVPRDAWPELYNTGPPKTLNKFILDFRYIAPFRNQTPLKAKFCISLPL